MHQYDLSNTLFHTKQTIPYLFYLFGQWQFIPVETFRNADLECHHLEIFTPDHSEIHD